jgi:competence CoiA-like predicted nuclease
MPLRAIINNEEIISINCDDEKWDTLQKKSRKSEIQIKLPCCNNTGFLRKSSLGLKHFAHKSAQNNCDWKAESLEHLKIKQEIIEGCKDTDWTAIPEFSENDWRADVLAFRGIRRIAFEVQWSPQTYQETVRRQERYKKSEVRGCWYFKKIPTAKNNLQGNLRTNKELPAFQLTKNKYNELVVLFNNKEINISTFTHKLVSGKIKHRSHYSILKDSLINVKFFKTTCSKCKKDQDVWTVDTLDVNIAKSSCGESILSNPYSYKGCELDLKKAVIRAVQNYNKTSDGSHLKIGPVKNIYNPVMGEEFLHHRCYYCENLLGNMFREKVDSNSSKIQTSILLTENWNIPDEHWCYSENGNFCLF